MKRKATPNISKILQVVLAMLAAQGAFGFNPTPELARPQQDKIEQVDLQSTRTSQTVHLSYFAPVFQQQILPTLSFALQLRAENSRLEVHYHLQQALQRLSTTRQLRLRFPPMNRAQGHIA